MKYRFERAYKSLVRMITSLLVAAILYLQHKIIPYTITYKLLHMLRCKITNLGCVNLLTTHYCSS